MASREEPVRVEPRRRRPPLRRHLQNYYRIVVLFHDNLSPTPPSPPGIDHSAQGIAVMSQMSQFFVNQARLSSRAFPSEQELESVRPLSCPNALLCILNPFSFWFSRHLR